MKEPMLPCSHAPMLAAVAVVVGLLGCAQASSPPGGERDRFPPRVIATVPDTNAIVTSVDGAVIIRFDETLSERGARADDLVAVSPETGEVEVDRKGRELRVEIEGGWQPGRIYHVTVLPGIQDRHGNQRPQTYELVFSTGPPILPTAIAGLVTDHLTRRAVANARVVATSLSDSLAYTTLTDTSGFFALRSLPLGAYNTVAFVDTNRNRTLDGLEARHARIVSLVTPQDTPVVELSVLALDTTPARLLRAEARDTIHARLAFDDFIAATEPLGSVIVSVWQLPDSVAVPSGSLMHPRDFEARQRALADTTRRAPAARPAAAPTDTVRLPTQELVWVPQQPFLPGTRYRVAVSGLRNIAGVAGGAGTTTFETPARPRVAPRDTAQARPTPPDTTRADTTRTRRR
ncbi:MAG: Ig-like domain-containing protein [Gemmatimonadota bacterium]